MKKRTSKFLFLLLTLVMVLGMLPMTAMAATGDSVDVWVGGIQMKAGYYLPSGNSPTAESLTTTQPTSGGYAYMKDNNALVLNNYSYEGEGYFFAGDNAAIFSDQPSALTIELQGTSEIIGTSLYGIWITGADLVITSDSNGVLKVSGGWGIHSYYALAIEDSTLDVFGHRDGIYAGRAFSITNSTVASVGEDGCGIYSHYRFTVTNSAVTAEGGEKGINNTWHGISITESTVMAKGGGYGIFSNAYDADISIMGSEVTAEGGWNGLYYNGDIFSIQYSTVTAVSEVAAMNMKPDLSAFPSATAVAGKNEASAEGVANLASEYHLNPYVRIQAGSYVPVWVGGIQMKEGYYLPSGNMPTEESLTTTQPSSGGYAFMDIGGVLVLNDYSYSGAGYDDCVVYSCLSLPLTVKLQGTNSLINTTNDSLGICAEVGSSNHSIGLIITGDGSLTASGTWYGIYSDVDIIIKDGTVNTSSEEGHGLFTLDGDISIIRSDVIAEGEMSGIYPQYRLFIEGGTVIATSGESFAITCIPDFSNCSSVEIKAGVDKASASVVSPETFSTSSPYVEIRTVPFLPADMPLVDVWVGGVQMKEGTYLPSSPDGTLQALRAEAPASGGYAYMKDSSTLVLNDYCYEGMEYDCVVDSRLSLPLTVELQGTNSLINSKETGVSLGIYVENAGLTISGSGSMIVTAGYDGIYVYGDITIADCTVTATGLEDTGMYADVGDITIINGTVNATGDCVGIEPYGCLTITDSTVTATGGEIGLTGWLTVMRSTVTATGVTDCGIECYAGDSFTESTVNATGGEYGFYFNEGAIFIKDCTVTAAGESSAMKARPDLSGFTTVPLVKAGDDETSAQEVADLATEYYLSYYVKIQNDPKATIVVKVGDVWNAGSGYQLLLDSDATAYGGLIPTTGALSTESNPPSDLYDAFEYKLPENADPVLDTINMLIDTTASFTIPAGTYDGCFTNPTPGDSLWIASENGADMGRFDDYEFEAGKTYTFTISLGNNGQDNIDLEITDTAPVEDTPTAIDSIEIRNVTEPVIGATAQFGFDIPADVGYSKGDGEGGGLSAWVESDTAPANYAELDDMEWLSEDDDLVFQADKYYTFIAYVGANDEFEFGDEITATINTNDANASKWSESDYNLYVDVWYTFGPLEAAPSTLSITVSPETADVSKGGTLQFTASVTGLEDQSIAWSVTGGSSAATQITNDGLLTVAEDESAETLTIKARATAVSTYELAGTASVTVTTTGTDIPTPKSIRIPFKKVVVGENAPYQKFEFIVKSGNGQPITDLNTGEPTVTCMPVETQGPGNYDGIVIITGTPEQLRIVNQLGIVITEKKTEAEGWTYSDVGYSVSYAEDGGFADFRSWNAAGPLPAGTTQEIVFTNTYTAYKPVVIPIEKIVSIYGSERPGKTTFEFEAFDYSYSGYYTDGGKINEAAPIVSGGVTITGEGTFTGEIVLTAAEGDNNLFDNLSEGFYICEKPLYDDRWFCSSSAYFVKYDVENEKWTFYEKYAWDTYCDALGTQDTSEPEPLEAAVFENWYTEFALPITKNVEQSGSIAPGKNEFTFNAFFDMFDTGEIVLASFDEMSDTENSAEDTTGNIGSVTIPTEGTGSFNGKIVFGAYSRALESGFYVSEVPVTDSDWIDDDAEYFVQWNGDMQEWDIYNAIEWRKAQETPETTVPTRLDTDSVPFTNTYTRNQNDDIDEAARCILTYESNGGTTYPNETYYYGENVDLDKTPVREGYGFTGWYSDRDVTNRITSITMNGRKTVYAGWNFNGPLNTKDRTAYIKGYPDGTIGPNNYITRAETAVMLYRLLTEERRAEITTTENAFSDVSSSNWYNKEVSSMAKDGYVKGYPDGTFGGDKPITRADFVTMIVRFINPAEGTRTFKDVPITHWAYENIATATAAGWIDGYADGSFGPDKFITRAEAITIINRVLNRRADSVTNLPNLKVWPDIKPSDWFYNDIIVATNGYE